MSNVEARWDWDYDDDIEVYVLVAPSGSKWKIAKTYSHPDDLLGEINALQAQADLAAVWRGLALNNHRRANQWYRIANELEHFAGDLGLERLETQTLRTKLESANDLAAGLRAAAELADELVKALRDCCTQVERFAKSSGMNARVNAYDTLYARYDALNPQPHHEETK